MSHLFITQALVDLTFVLNSFGFNSFVRSFLHSLFYYYVKPGLEMNHPEHILRKIITAHFDRKSWTPISERSFYPKISIFQPNFRITLFCHCTDSLSSLHISIHHCKFCASLHVKTSPGTICVCNKELAYIDRRTDKQTGRQIGR